MTQISPQIDLRGQLAAVRDQGSRPTCLAFAVSDAHGLVRSQSTELSCEYLYYQAQKIDGRDATSGATLPSILTALQIEGQPAECDWPYIQKSPAQVMRDWQPPTYIGTLYRRNAERQNELVSNVVKQLEHGIAVISLLFLSDPFYSAVPGKIVSLSGASKPDINRRHAVLTLGVGDGPTGRCFLIRNSWGTGWCDKGHAWLSEEFYAASLYETAILKGESNVSASAVTA
jgi:C1A family cysteine protease